MIWYGLLGSGITIIVFIMWAFAREIVKQQAQIKYLIEENEELRKENERFKNPLRILQN